MPSRPDAIHALPSRSRTGSTMMAGAVATTHPVTGDAQQAVDATRADAAPTATEQRPSTRSQVFQSTSPAGRTKAMAGPPGSGTSTLIQLLAGLSRPTTGGRLDRLYDHHRPRRHRAHQVPPAHRLHPPALQPATD